jgi:hypothetical protein
MARLRGDLTRLDALLAQYEARIRDAFIAAILSARRAIDVRALEAALEAQDISRAVELLRMNQALLFPLESALAAAYVAGGQMVAAGAPMTALVFGFDGRHPRAEQWTRNHVGTLITNIVQEQVELTRQVIERQLIAGISPRDAALDIVGRVNLATGRREGGLYGLDIPRANRLAAVVDGMKTPEGVRSLVIDGEGGPRVKYKVNPATEQRILRAYRDGTAVSPADRAISARQYENMLLKARGETIARTESITALRAGRREGIEQAIEQGAIQSSRIKRRWNATMDARTRPDHEAMHRREIEGMEAPWVLPDGSRMMFPGDTSLGAAADQTINCRCYEEFVVDWLRA